FTVGFVRCVVTESVMRRVVGSIMVGLLILMMAGCRAAPAAEPVVRVEATRTAPVARPTSTPEVSAPEPTAEPPTPEPSSTAAPTGNSADATGDTGGSAEAAPPEEEADEPEQIVARYDPDVLEVVAALNEWRLQEGQWPLRLNDTLNQ